MLARTQLIQIQKALYDKLKKHTRQYLGGLSPDLKHYFKEYQDTLKNYECLTSNRQLLIDLIKCHVIFCGDYHTLSQSQRTVLRLLKATEKILARQKRPIMLALEMFSPKDQSHLDRYLAGRLSEKRLLTLTRFRKRWGFQWENYLPLLRHAKEQGIRVIGLDPGREMSLKERDRFAAHLITEVTAEDPTLVLFVLIGDLHLASTHLPSDFERCLRREGLERRSIVVHQNSEKFYWSLVEQGLERYAEVIKVKEGVYCVMNTPPWVKLQSHLKWVEMISEGAEPRGGARDYALSLDSLDHSHEVEEILKILKDFFEIQEALQDDFHVRGPMNLSFLENLEKRHVFSKKELALLARSLMEFDSQFFPRSNDLFLTNLGINHLAAQAAYLLHSKLSGFQGVFGDPRRDFFTFVWIEALAFLCSKLLNPKRKTPSETILRRRFRSAFRKGDNRSLDSRTLKVVLAHLEQERKKDSRMDIFLEARGADRSGSKDRVLVQYKAVKILGAFLGGGLYSGLYEGRVGKDEIRELFYCSFTVGHRPKERYWKWVRRLDEHRYRDVIG